MGKHPVLILLVAVGVGLAVLVGLAGARGSGGTSSESAQANLCSSLNSLESSTQALVSLSPQSASKDDYQSAVATVKSDWQAVADDAGDVASATMSTLDSAWDTFQQAVDDVPSDATVSGAIGDVQTAGKALVSTTKSTISGVGCS
jgi:hypothetical protein